MTPGPPPQQRRPFRHLVPGSLQLRMLLVTVVALGGALVLAGVVLNSLFREHVRQQFQQSLELQLDQVTARLVLQGDGTPALEAQALSDPRWLKPYSGLYWQVDQVEANGQAPIAVLRSRSLWDFQLRAPADALADGAVHAHDVSGPLESQLLLLERTVFWPEQARVQWRILVGADLASTRAAHEQFGRVLAASLAALFASLVGVALLQWGIGLRPLRALQGELQDMQNALKANLQGHYPTEIQPLVADFNRVLDNNRRVLERSRTQAGNLAHALKTPLAVLEQAASQTLQQRESDLAHLVQSQVATARRHIDWHMARARAAGSSTLPGQSTDVIATLKGLIRVMEKVHADKGLSICLADAASMPPMLFAGEEQDLQEMLGNLLDNSCKWATHCIDVEVRLLSPAQLCIAVQDDGPGIAAEHIKQVTARGIRLDETVPGSGLGLAITQELAGLYGGQLKLTCPPNAGLCASLHLPAKPLEPMSQ